jgi:hypothetical protein
MYRYFLILILCSAIFFMGSDIYAQLDVSETNSLAFGNMFPGIPKTVSKYTPGAAAEYLVTGTAGAEITIDFTLPTYMNSVGHNIQLIFSESDCSMDSSASYDQTSPGNDNLDPWHQMTYRIGSNGLRIWLGGQAVPKLNQPQGSYSASIVITVAYTGS